MKKLGIAFYTIFGVLFAGLPLYILSLSARAMEDLEGFEEIRLKYLAFALIAAAICALPLESLWAKLPQRQGCLKGEPLRFPDWLAFMLWGIAAFKYRCHCFGALKPYIRMEYDFAAALESARGVYQAKEAIFTHWAYYPRLLSIWFNKTQDWSYENAAYFNFLVCALTVSMVYALARLVFKHQRSAMLAAGIACFWPSFAYYACVTTNEHFAMLMMLFTGFFALAAARLAMAAGKEKAKLRGLSSGDPKYEGAKPNLYFVPGVLWLLAVCFAAAAGVSAGLADLFKQFSPVFYIAAGATALVFLLIEWRKNSRENFHRLIAIAAAFAIMLASTAGVRSFARSWLENYLGEPVAKSATAHFLWIGLNSRGGGEWSSEEGLMVYKLAEEYNKDYDRVMEELMALLKADLAENRDALPDTIRHKMEKDWAADRGIMLWLKALYDDEAAWSDANGGADPSWVPREEKDLYDFDPDNSITRASGAFYMAVMSLIAIGGFAAVIRRRPGEMYLRLVFYGYALLFILSEAQGRYQVVLFPIFAILAAGAGEQIGDILRDIREIFKRRKYGRA